MGKEIFVIVSIDSCNIENLGIDKKSGEEIYRVSQERFDENGVENDYEMKTEWEDRGYSSVKYFYL